MRLAVAFVPQLVITGDDICIVIDVLRDRTTLTPSVDSGARTIIVAPDHTGPACGAVDRRNGRPATPRLRLRQLPGAFAARPDLGGRDAICHTSNDARALDAVDTAPRLKHVVNESIVTGARCATRQSNAS